MRKKVKVIFIHSHPIQYFAPLYKKVSESFSSITLFCSGHGLKGEKDREFGVNIKWDIPVLDGYDYLFLKNQSWKKGIYGFWGLMNLSIFPYLLKNKKSLLVVNGWGYFSYIFTLLIGRRLGHVVCLRGENPANQEHVKKGFSAKVRSWFFKNILFPSANYIFYIGQQNKQFYLNYGVNPTKLIFSPYSVDNKRFQEEYKKLAPKKNELRKELNLPLDKKIILFSGKYIQKKRPLDLLEAFNKCQRKEDAFLVFMGDGNLRPDMEMFVKKNNLQNVQLTGFVNQSKVSHYYAAADVFVMCSQEGETWGLSTNEAMNFKLPVILSDMIGSAYDLVEEGKNGWRFKMGDTDGLAEKINLFMGLSEKELKRMGERSGELINGYSYTQIIEGLEKVALNTGM